jgi:hypothetical protein
VWFVRGTQQTFFIQAQQNVSDYTVEYRVVVPKAFMETLPHLREFEGWFNINNVELVNPHYDRWERADWIRLNPEALSVQLLRLAYIAAASEEGPFGSDDDVPSPL